MSVDTRGYIKGWVSDKEIMRILKYKYGVKAESGVVDHTKGLISEITWPYRHFGNDNRYLVYYGFISFVLPNGEQRQIFYHYSNVSDKEEDQYYIKQGLEKMVHTHKTYISLGCWGSSVQILKDIIEEFGGWIDENDCDDKSFYYVRKKSSR